MWQKIRRITESARLLRERTAERYSPRSRPCETYVVGFVFSALKKFEADLSANLGGTTVFRPKT